LPVLVLFLSFDIPFFASNLFKIVDGGWVPILIGAGFVIVMLVWSKGRSIVIGTYANQFPSFEEFAPQLEKIDRVPGTAVYLASRTDHLPPALVHLLSRNHVLHEHVILLTVQPSDSEPRIPEASRVEISELGERFYRVVIRSGFSEQPQVHDVLARMTKERNIPFGPDDATYFLARMNLLATGAGQMGALTEGVYSFLQRNSVTADRYFGLPSEQVMEIGTQLDL
jgi:KUP system potassium uptake protein